MRLLGAQANVLHPDAVAPSQRAAVPINIRNTANPTHPGTLIVHDDDERAQRGAAQQVVGVTIQDEAVVVVCTAISHVDQVAAVLKAEAPAGDISLGKEFRSEFSPLGSLAGCFLAPGSGLGLVGTASSGR